MLHVEHSANGIAPTRISTQKWDGHSAFMIPGCYTWNMRRVTRRIGVNLTRKPSPVGLPVCIASGVPRGTRWAFSGCYTWNILARRSVQGIREWRPFGSVPRFAHWVSSGRFHVERVSR